MRVEINITTRTVIGLVAAALFLLVSASLAAGWLQIRFSADPTWLSEFMTSSFIASFAPILTINGICVVLGMCGGALVPIIEWLDNLRKPIAERLEITWHSFFFLPLFGGLLVTVYELSQQNLQPIVALNIGMTAMIILRSMAAKAPSGAIPLEIPDPDAGGSKALKQKE